ncbi:MAG: GntR family transcriptional regulator [Beutenbergiaceae bacterium]
MSRPSRSQPVVEGSRRVRSAKVSTVVTDDLRQRIRAGEWSAGEPIPPEMDLASEYAVSRGTIRSALRDLATEGLVITKHGSGTYVTQFSSGMRTNLRDLTSMTATIEHAGMDSTMRYTLREEKPADEQEAGMLGIAEADPVVHTRREVEAGGLMVAVSFDTIRRDALPPDFDITGFEGSIFRLFDELDRPIRYATSEVHAAVGHDFGLHAEASEEPFLMMFQTHFDSDNEPIFFARTYFREGKFSFTLMRVREGNTA